MLDAAVATLDPGYFALVMSTGIVSVAVRRQSPRLSDALLWLTAICYVVLVVLTVFRAVRFPRALRAELADPARGFLVLTFVAGTDVLGTGLAASGDRGVALALLAVAGGAWVVLGYAVPWAAVLRGIRPLLRSTNATWFLWVVACQSVAVLAATLEPAVLTGRRELALLAVACWSVGIVLYGAVGVFVAARMMAYPFRPADLTPAYWVAMGATAITVVAGARVVGMADAPTVVTTRALATGCSVVLLAFGTWLIPPLAAAEWWRHVTHRVPLRYEPALWSIAFPLGMYGVAGQDIGVADHLPLVRVLGENEAWLGLAVWAVTGTAMVVHLLRAAALHTADRSQLAG